MTALWIARLWATLRTSLSGFGLVNDREELARINRKLDGLAETLRWLVERDEHRQLGTPDARTPSPIIRILQTAFEAVNRRLDKLMIDVAKITAAAQRANAGIDSVLAVLGEATTQIAALSKQLADAIAAADPAAQQAVQTQLDTLADGLNAEADKIAAATTKPADPSA